MYHKAHAMILCDFLWLKIWENICLNHVFNQKNFFDMYLATITNTISKWYKNIFRIWLYDCWKIKWGMHLAKKFKYIQYCTKNKN